jgi:hypothetical protein
MGTTHSREGAARACLNGVLAECDRRTIKHLPASIVRTFIVFLERRREKENDGSNVHLPQPKKSS